MKRLLFLCSIMAGLLIVGCVGDRALSPEVPEDIGSGFTNENWTLSDEVEQLQEEALNQVYIPWYWWDILGETLAVDPDSLQPAQLPQQEG